MTSQDIQADIEAIGAIPVVPAILETVCRITGMGFAAVARVTSQRWTVCAVRDGIAFGLKPGGELKLETTICHEIRQSGHGVVIDHVAQSEAWRDHHTPAAYGFQSYISMPIFTRDGDFFGTLCAIDPKPARLDNPEITGMFRMFAELIAFHLEANERLLRSEASLSDERHAAELREQFIAVLGHDLRNPLASIASGVRLLGREASSEKAQTVVKLMQQSVARMTHLINDVLDFARGRLGGGFAVRLERENLGGVLAEVAAELGAGYSGREIVLDIGVDEPVRGDKARLAQLFSNLLGNALAHGAKDRPVKVRAATRDGYFELAVSNSGNEIPPATLAQLFRPFVRGAPGGGRQGQGQGLGLGLYIASEIARAHGGTLGAVSSPEETCFTFRMALG
jgi:signal transduction histidine kinase